LILSDGLALRDPSAISNSIPLEICIFAQAEIRAEIDTSRLIEEPVEVKVFKNVLVFEGAQILVEA
jgi:hypothetical protein